MRVTLFLFVGLLAAAVFAPSAQAQGTIPYRRTIDYLPNRPYEWTGRYVRLNVTFSRGPGPMGRSITSLGVQPTISPGVGQGPVGSAGSGNGGGNDLGAGGVAVPRVPAMRSAGFGRGFRFGR
jgi:hypothetical protein